MPPVSVQVPAAISAASPEPVIEAAAQLGSADPAWPFLPGTSSLLEGRALSFVETLFNQNPYVIPLPTQTEELAQYLALATVSHVLDGWRYISQAALALLTGSRTQALHLAYYAELRAGLSILARSGIGVLKRKHFVLTPSRDVIWFQGASHEITWQAIDQWAKQPGHGLEVLRCFSYRGLTGEQWAQATGSAPSTVAEYWLDNWTMDLHSLGNDSDLRNEASYRPNLRSNALAQVSDTDLRFVLDASVAANPVDYGQFDFVDRVVIYDLCKKSYKLLHDPPSRSTFEAFWDNLAQRTVLDQGISEDDARGIVTSIRESYYGPGGKLVIGADKKNIDATAVFSRAFLLLRLASALLRTQWKETRRRKTPQDWQERLILDYVSHSLACDGEFPTKDYTILLADQEEAVEELDSWFGRNQKFNPYVLWKDQSHALVSLCRFERVGAVAVTP